MYLTADAEIEQLLLGGLETNQTSRLCIVGDPDEANHWLYQDVDGNWYPTCVAAYNQAVGGGSPITTCDPSDLACAGALVTGANTVGRLVDQAQYLVDALQAPGYLHPDCSEAAILSKLPNQISSTSHLLKSGLGCILQIVSRLLRPAFLPFSHLW